MLFYIMIHTILFLFFFFFSSRRRHTRFDCDWSSDVCSSDLDDGHPPLRPPGLLLHQRLELVRASLVRVAEKRLSMSSLFGLILKLSVLACLDKGRVFC